MWRVFFWFSLWARFLRTPGKVIVRVIYLYLRKFLEERLKYKEGAPTVVL